MIYKLIERARNNWLQSDSCTVKNLLLYMERKALLRDAQLESVKTFLFLKLACGNKPLWELMNEGAFNTLDLDILPLTVSTRAFLTEHPEAQALYEYAIEKNDSGESNAPLLAKLICEHPEAPDYAAIIKQLLHGVTYVDYLFSLPMGAGKTWLMAMFVYLNLYFAINEPDNLLFAHNFIIVAPAGLKSSILPSITKDLRDFDPSMIFPEPIAGKLKSIVQLEILGETSAAKGSNTVHNPNAQKVQRHQPFRDLKGLVMVTNAEKLYDRIEKSDEIPALWNDLPEEQRATWLPVKLANELREIIGRLPNLCIMVDEMHHASGEQQLRKVIELWVETASFNSLLGFSGTPYFPSSKNIRIAEGLGIRYSMLGNVVTYYPLANAVGNFVKVPEIKHSDVSSMDIVRNGVRDFLRRFKDKSYAGTGCAKLAIYCGLIATLENEIYPEVCSICNEFGLDANDTVLRYYGNQNKEGFRCAPTAEADFRSLDSPFSKYKIILLAQIGKEGWNCKSLTGVILPNANSSARNMVLQTSCRCLREVEDAATEKALIWLSKLNYDLLSDELRKTHHTTVAELSKSGNRREVKRYSRQDVVKLPDLTYYQLHITYKIETSIDNDPKQRLAGVSPSRADRRSVMQSDINGHSEYSGLIIDYDTDTAMWYNEWLYLISKESFGLITTSELKEYSDILRPLYDSVTYVRNGIRYLSKEYKQQQLRADIRKCFTPQTYIKCIEETVPHTVSILNAEPLDRPYYPSESRIIFPNTQTVERIIKADKGSSGLPVEIQKGIESLRAAGNDIAADMLEKTYQPDAIPDNRNKRTYQYIPYSFDSGLEQSYYDKILRGLLNTFPDIEIYFNGDESMTDFCIECYAKTDTYWKRISNYYPDFLILRRNADNQIEKVILVETKGTVYESSFRPKKDFMDKFIAINKASKYTQFEFLYIPESCSEESQYDNTLQKIQDFLNA